MAVVAALVVTLFTIDLGTIRVGRYDLKRGAEAYASRFLKRPMHIGRVSAMLTPGDFVFDDVSIEGRRPEDRPFFKAKRIVVHVPWWTIFKKQIYADVTLDDWAMVVESWPGSITNIPNLKRQGGGGKSPITTTVPFVHARNGSFIYEDHATPWHVIAPNLNFSLVRSEALKTYVGTARFEGGEVQIQNYKPMRTSMTTRFVLDAPRVNLQHIDLITDGSESHVSGQVDFSRWPNQIYNVNSTVDFARMKEIFFFNESWKLGGQGSFKGVFRLFDGGRELAGEFASDRAQFNRLEFPNLHGGLIWTNDKFAVTHADSDFLGGRMRLSYTLAPIGTPNPATATFATDYSNLDLSSLSPLIDLRGLQLTGRANGSLSLQWPNGHFRERKGEGHTFVSPPADLTVATRELPAVARAVVPEPRPFRANRPLGMLAVVANAYYQLDEHGVTFDDSSAATAFTYVKFKGRMTSVGSSAFDFHVTSHDWQESDRVLAAIMSAISGQTGAIEIGGRGTFDGQMTGTFSAPRIAGRFEGDDTRVWDVNWGHAVGDAVIEGGYVDIAKVRIGDTPDRWIESSGRFALGFRKDNAEEIRARVQLTNWPIVDLRHAFVLDDWPMEGTVGSAVLDLSGKYRTMYGSGRLRIDNGSAWKERFESATSEVALEGNGIRMNNILLRKGPGTVRGAARIGWDGTYAFNADGEGIAVESLDNFTLPAAPLTGVLRFKTSGASQFDVPSYAFEGAIDDLFAGDEGIGPVTGRISVTNKVMTIERFVAASSRLQVHGSGTIALDDVSTSDLRLRFQQTSIDPYLKFFLPQVSPYAQIIISGGLSVRGPLSLPEALTVDTTIDEATLALRPDFALTNDGPLQIGFDRNQLRIGQLKLQGRDTNLAVTGGADLGARTLNLAADGSSNLALLELFPLGLTASGGATVAARLQGTFSAPLLTGRATVLDGRLRPLGSPHGLDAINGALTFGANAINLNGVTGRIGSGDVAFGGSIVLDGFTPVEYNLTASGRSMRLRYPAGFNSTVNMDLQMLGPIGSPRLVGDIDVLRVALAGSGEQTANLFGLATASVGGGSATAPSVGLPTPIAPVSGTQLALDIRVSAPRTTFIDTKTATIDGAADLRVQGTFDRPAITGTINIAGGQAIFNGNRFFIQQGSIDFTNPDRLEPVLDIAAETRPRLLGQTYVVKVGIAGEMGHLTFNLTSEPSLSQVDILSLIVGGRPDVGTSEQRELRMSDEQLQRNIQMAAAAFVGSAISTGVGAVMEKTIPLIDTVAITPLLPDQTTSFAQLNPSARITLGTRISNRVFLTYSRTVTGSQQDEIILLEYDASDRVSWVLSRNEDRTFALDFRIRYAF